MRHLHLMFLLIVCYLLSAAPALAGPVLPEPLILSQPDGTIFVAVPFGDEWDNGYETADGFTVVQDPTSGVWWYAALSADGRLVPSALQATRDLPVGLTPHLRNTDVFNPNRFAVFPEREAGPTGNTGNQAVLVLLVSFSDRPPVGSTAAQWNSQFFGATNSARHYYQEVSYGQLALVPSSESHGTVNDGIIGWLNLGYPHPNTAGSTGDANRQIVRDAIYAADPYINFASYDANHDGYIAGTELRLVVIVAGYEASYGGAASACSPSVWAHQWALFGAVPAPTVDGVIVAASGHGGYSQFGEWHCSSSDNPGHMGTMGQMVHEMGHDLGWPDLYDVDGSSNGVGYWSIMGSGSWLKTTGYSGSKPGHPDAFLKWYQGWLTPQQVMGTATDVPLQQIETNQRAVQVLNNPGGVDWLFQSHSGTGEYFLLENRQQVGYDAGLPGCGIVIWHIDESRTATNYANATDSRRLVDIEEADGRNDLDTKTNRGDAGDPYPGSSGNTAFDNSSNPNSRLYSGASSGVSVTGFSTCASTMTADIASSAGPTPAPTSWTVYLPVILLNVPPATATPTRTATPPGGWVIIMSQDFEGSFPGEVAAANTRSPSPPLAVASTSPRGEQLPFGFGPLPLPPAQGTDYAAGELLVRFQDHLTAEQRWSTVRDLGLHVLGELLLNGILRVQVPQGQELEWAKKLAGDPRILYAEPNYYIHAIEPPKGMQRVVELAPGAVGLEITPNDPLFGTYQWNMRKINGREAWDANTGSNSVILAVIDTGVDLSHPDFSCANKLTAGYDFYNNDGTPDDDNGHGTHVAGIAGACSNNGVGVAGVNWNVRIMPLKVLSATGSGPVSAEINAITWAVDHGARVLNLSLGSANYSQAEADAVNYAYTHDVLVVAAAGNEYEEGNPVEYPAAYNHVMAVAATGDLDEHAAYSNSGSYVDIAAPGGNATSSSDPNNNHWIMSTWKNDGYAQVIGTSQATPHVAGLAAIIRGMNPALTSDQVQALIQNTAVDIGAVGRDDFFGYGRINAQAAVLAASGGGTTPTPTATSTPIRATPTPTATATPTGSGTWTVFGANGYQWARRSCRPYAGGFSGWGVGGGSNGAGLGCGSNYPNNADSLMIYGPFSLVGATDADMLYKLWLQSETGYDKFCVYASVDNNNFYGTCYWGNSSGWVDQNFDLTNVYMLGNLLGRPKVWIAFRFYSDSSIMLPEGAYVDNIILRKCTAGSCLGGSLLEAGMLTAEPAQMTLH